MNLEKLCPMLSLRMAARKIARSTLSVGFRRSDSIPIMLGPLAGRVLPKAVAMQNLGMVFGRYEPWVVRELFLNSKFIRVAYDIGAHIGFMTLALAQCIGRTGNVFAFEPQPDNLLLLERLIFKNNLLQVVKVIPIAVGAMAEKETLFIGKSSSLNFLKSASGGQDISNCSSITVTKKTLDAFVFEEGNPAPDILKVDVEGAEAMVIEGALQILKRFSPKLLIEIHGPINAHKSYSRLNGLGYEWWLLTRKGRECIRDKQHLLSLFSKDSWTHHFLVIKGDLDAV
jgi:FkbM family methyltransferase